MSEGEFQAGVVVGVLTLALSLLITWHLAESECQQKHNVSDCVLASPAFAPASEESK